MAFTKRLKNAGNNIGLLAYIALNSVLIVGLVAGVGYCIYSGVSCVAKQAYRTLIERQDDSLTNKIIGGELQRSDVGELEKIAK